MPLWLREIISHRYRSSAYSRELIVSCPWRRQIGFITNENDEVKNENVKANCYCRAIAAGASSSALASSYQCDSGPKSEWKSKEETREMLVAEGYDVRKLKVKGGCYEFYAKKDGEKLEVFINPATLKIVNIKQG